MIAANFRDVNLKTLMQATIRHMQTMSLTIMLWELKYQPITVPIPTTKLTSYRIRNYILAILNNFIIKILNLNRNRT